MRIREAGEKRWEGPYRNAYHVICFNVRMGLCIALIVAILKMLSSSRPKEQRE